MLDRLVHNELMQMLRACGSVYIKKDGESCFKLSSGLHTRAKYDFSRAFQYKEIRERLAREFVGMLGDEMDASAINVIAGPESMGPFFAEMQNFSYFALSSCRLALVKKDRRGTFFFEENCDLRPGDRILLVDDVFTTSRTLEHCAEALRVWYGPMPHPRMTGAVLLERTIVKGEKVLSAPVSFFPLHLLSDKEHFVYSPFHCEYCIGQS